MAVNLPISSILLFPLILPLLLPFLRRKHDRPLPPGPRPIPLLGNLHQQSWSEPWKTYREWHQMYGPLVSFKIGPYQVISVGTHQVAKDLLERRGAIYSSRPESAWSQFMTKGQQPVFQSYNNSWKLMHKLQMPLLSTTAVNAYLPLLDLETKQLLHGLVPPDRRGVNSVFAVSFHEIKTIIDGFFKDIHWTYILLDLIPGVKYMPSWMIKFKQVSDAFYKNAVRTFNRVFSRTINIQKWTWVRAVMTHRDAQKTTWEQICFALGELWTAMSVTTPVMLMVFTRLSLLNRDKFLQLQQEVDSVCGPDRLPSPEVVEHLPYLNAYIQEMLRFDTLVPLGFLRSVDKDDEYMGYRIPANTIIIPNTWCLDHDETIYPDQYNFHPERWLADPNLPLGAFGFGRRKCPGRFLATRSMQLAIARIAWAFNIVWNADPIPTSPRYVGFILRPRDFLGVFQPRSLERREVIEQEWSDSERLEDDYTDIQV
ncbi:cytochrome P450 [Aspergillus floccosus]